MKFCDKLQKIRKENNITQEGLADKLNVSRQAVSKWESGQAYPDTEKLIQISKLFKVSLDELVNDNVDTNKGESKKKFNFMETFDMIFESVRKVFSMFFAMKFSQKIKFLIEMALVILAIFLTAQLLNGIILGIIRRIFTFLPYQIYHVIDYIFYTLLYVLWLILGAMVFIRVLKIRYLDYYVIIEDDSVTEPTIEEPIKELKERKETKVVIRDPEHSGSSFLDAIIKMIVFFIKCLCLFILIPIVASFVGFIVIFVISLSFLLSGIFFNGITLTLLGIILFFYLLIEFIYNIIVNRKINYLKVFIIFIASVAMMGIGVGVSFVSLANFTTYDAVENIEKNTKTIEVAMTDNLVFTDLIELPTDKIVIDNNLDTIKVDITTYGKGEPYINKSKMYNHIEDQDNYLDTIYVYVDTNELELYKNMVKDLKKQKVGNYSIFEKYDIDKVYISDSNLTKLKENYDKFLN